MTIHIAYMRHEFICFTYTPENVEYIPFPVLRRCSHFAKIGTPTVDTLPFLEGNCLIQVAAYRWRRCLNFAARWRTARRYLELATSEWPQNLRKNLPYVKTKKNISQQSQYVSITKWAEVFNMVGYNSDTGTFSKSQHVNVIDLGLNKRIIWLM